MKPEIITIKIEKTQVRFELWFDFHPGLNSNSFNLYEVNDEGTNGNVASGYADRRWNGRTTIYWTSVSREMTYVIEAVRTKANKIMAAEIRRHLRGEKID